MRKIAISKEYLDKINAFTAIKPEEKFDYVPLAYRELPEELQPVFHLVTISGLDIVSSEDSLRGGYRMAEGGTEIIMQRGAHTKRICSIGLKGWTNYYTADGTIIDYDEKESAEYNLGRVNPELLHEITNAILNRTRLSEEERLG